MSAAAMLNLKGGAWENDAACRDADPELFFAEEKSQPVAIEQARSVCRGCVVKDDCLVAALRDRRAYGVFGGHTASERRRLAPALGFEPAPRTPGGREAAIA